MIRGAWNTISLFRETVAGGDTPRQIGFGVAMGMLIGLMPKDSLFAYFFGLVLLVSTANLLSAMISGFAFSWIGFLLDPLSHFLGSWFLQMPRLQPTFARLYELPVVPWTRFENTVVTGSLLIGLVLFVPIYLGSTAWTKKHGAAIHEKLGNFFLYRWILGAELAPRPAGEKEASTEAVH